MLENNGNYLGEPETPPQMLVFGDNGPSLLNVKNKPVTVLQPPGLEAPTTTQETVPPRITPLTKPKPNTLTLIQTQVGLTQLGNKLPTVPPHPLEIAEMSMNGNLARPTTSEIEFHTKDTSGKLNGKTTKLPQLPQELNVGELS